MSLQTFSLDAVQKLNQYVQTQLVLPASEQQPALETRAAMAAEEPPEPSSLDMLGDMFRAGGFEEEDSPAPNTKGRWFISTIDPGAALYKLPGLSLKPGVRLVTYLQRRPDGGLGVTWALPELMSTTTHLEEALEAAGDQPTPPRPRGALGHIMDGFTGDQRPASYVSASLLLRHLKELGRTGKLRRWSHHRLIPAVPTQYSWQWKGNAPKDLSPKFKYLDEKSVMVEFFSCRVVPPVALFRHLDQYGSAYRAKSNDQVIALLQAQPKG
ncbi:MAG: hypothetical protein ACFB0C_14215 [Leptolyngbyaceae cyanobacterium]